MTHFSYNDSDLSTDLNKVRRLIGDVSSTAGLFSDEEITFFIDEEANIYGAASVACESLSAKFAEGVSKTVGKLSLELQQKFDHFSDLAETFKTKSKMKGGIQLFAGGLTISGKQTERSDTDRVDPSFRRDMHDFPGTGLDEGSST